jgi:UPF0042 nucleotide-binding protein
MLSIHELRRRIVSSFGPGASGGEVPRMSIRFVSFGFKFGTPVDADLVLDVRFIDNPNFVNELRHLPGTDPAIISYVLDRDETQQFVTKAKDLLAFTLPRYEREGKAYLTVGIGCTGGRHRSVVLADHLAKELTALTGLNIAVVHRDLGRLPAERAEADLLGSGGTKGGRSAP